MSSPPGGTVTRVQPSAFGCITIPFLLIALIPLGYGARSQWSNRALLHAGQVVEGRVTALDYVPGNSSARNGRGSALSPTVHGTGYRLTLPTIWRCWPVRVVNATVGDMALPRPLRADELVGT